MRKVINHVLSIIILAYITLVLANERERSNENARSIFDTITYNIDSFYGMMYLDAWLGTPSQRVTLAISLTSDLMVVPCNDVCNSNCEGNPYLSKTSHTFENVTCDKCTELLGRRSTCDKDNCLALGSFLDDSIYWDGTLSSDMAYFGGAPVEATPNIAQDYGNRFIFGCQMKYNDDMVVSRWVRKRANGIISFSPSKHSLTKQLHTHNLLQNSNFALCFYSRLSTLGPAGVLSLGGYTLVEDDESSPLIYLETEFGKNYAVFVEQIFLHSETNKQLQNIPLKNVYELNNDGKGAIIDAGSPISFLGSDEFGQEFRSAWKKITGDDFPEDGGTFLKTDMEKLPTIKIQLKATGEKDDNTIRRRTRRKLEFGFSGSVGEELDPEYPDDALLLIPPKEYLDYDSDNLSYHIRLFLGTSDQKTILGGNLFRSHLLYFNLEEEKLGIALQSYCGRASIKNQQKEGNQYDYSIDQKHNGNTNTNGVADTNSNNAQEESHNSQSSPNNPNPQSNPIDQKPQMSNPVGQEISTKSNGNVINNPSAEVEDEGSMSSFDMNIVYYIAATVLFVLFLALSIYNCKRCSDKRRRRQTI